MNSGKLPFMSKKKTSENPSSTNSNCSCLYFSTAALGRLMSDLADKAFIALNLKAPHGILLITVNQNPGITAGEVAKRMLLAPSTVTRFIEKMESKRLLRRETNGRTVQVFPTEKSLSLNKDLEKCWANVSKEYSKVLGLESARKLAMESSEAYFSLSRQA
jgi:DNA-binding MarR family transcriptional regulator